MLFHMLDALLGTTTKVRVLRALIQLDSVVSGSEAQRLARVRSAESMWAVLNELTELGIISREEMRGSHLYRVNREHELSGALAALFEAEAVRFSRLRDGLQVILAEAGLMDAVCSVLLYGSNARGEATARSDVDLLVVTDVEGRVRDVREALLYGAASLQERLGLRISPYVLTRGRAEERHREGDPLLRTIAEEGQLVLGESLLHVIHAL